MRLAAVLILASCFAAAQAHSYWSGVAEGSKSPTVGSIVGYIHKKVQYWNLTIADAEGFTTAVLVDGNPSRPGAQPVVTLVSLSKPLFGDADFAGSFNDTNLDRASGYNTTTLQEHIGMGHIHLVLNTTGGVVYGDLEAEVKAAAAPSSSHSGHRK